jgi:hypothetical protein
MIETIGKIDKTAKPAFTLAVDNKPGYFGRCCARTNHSWIVLLGRNPWQATAQACTVMVLGALFTVATPFICVYVIATSFREKENG